MSDAQLSLWATGPLARATDPATSQAAPPDATVLSELQGLVLDEFHAAETRYVATTQPRDMDGVLLWPRSYGLTDEELAARFPTRCAGTTKKRRTELTRKGLLIDSGARRPTVTGRDAIVWRVAPDV